MAAITSFLGILSGALGIGLALKSLDGLFEWSDSRRRANLEALLEQDEVRRARLASQKRS